MFARITTFLLMLALTSAATAQVKNLRTGLPVSHNLPPAVMLAEPGPGVGGPGPGVLSAAGYASTVAGPADDITAACGPFGSVAHQSVQVLFDKPEGMFIYWDVSGVGMYDSSPSAVPFRQNFSQGGVFRLKLTDINGRPGLELYPTLEVGRVTPRTAAYLAHAAIPIRMTQEDFDQVSAGNFVTKVIYVPDPEFQELALAGVDVLVSTRLDPGVDPIVEADRRGAILAILRVGNKDLEIPGQNPAVMAGAMPASVNRGAGTGSSDYVSGISGPSYGMPWTGTQIGLPGPPHIPLGGQAGLKNYSVHNHTAMQIPGPTPNVNVHVKQRPGLTYPRPADKVLIQENTIRPPHANAQPAADMLHGSLPYQKNPLNFRR
ncbi:MAG: hypothetical protein AAGA30_14110 [Planctomycetota bacterium]